MTSVNFRSFEMSDRNDALTIENVYKKYAAFSGIHKFEFVDDINTFDAAKWTTVADISYTNGYVSRTDTIGEDNPIWYSDEMPHSYTVEFTAHEERWAYYCRADASGTNNNSYLVDYTGTYLTFTAKLGGVDTVLFKKQMHGFETNLWNRVKISVRDQQFNSEDRGRIIYLAVWINDHLIAAVGDNVYVGNPPLYMGFVVPSGDAGIVYSDIRVANLGETIIWSSLDPGEKAISAIQRAIEDRYIRAWIRWNGALKAWKPKARDVSATIPVTKEFHNAPTIDQRQVISDIKMLGAFQWVQVMDKDLVRDFGRVHAELNNTALWNADDVKIAGLNMLLRVKEQIYQIRFVTAGLPYLEYEDRIKVPNPSIDNAYVDYIFDGGSWSYKDGVFELEITGRGYFY